MDSPFASFLFYLHVHTGGGYLFSFDFRYTLFAVSQGNFSPFQTGLIVVLPQFATIALFFVFTKLAYGHWIGHYGSGAVLKIPLSTICSNVIKYLLKYGFYTQFLEFPQKEKLYQFLEQTKVAYSLFGCSVLLIGILLLRFNRLKNESRISLLLFIFFNLGLLAVITMYFNWVLHNEADRLGYFASLFFYCFPKLKYFLSIGFICLTFYFCKQNLSNWKKPGIVVNNLMQKFHWESVPQVYFLNLPDASDGAFIFRSYGGSSVVREYLQVYRNLNPSGKMYDLLKYNMNALTDSVFVEKVDSMTLKISLAQCCEWWWQSGIGAADYQTDNYSVHIDGGSYYLHMKSKPKDTVFLYQAGLDWRQVSGF